MTINNYTFKTFFYTIIIFFCAVQNFFSQTTIDSMFVKYNSVYKEVVYAHLNKSLYIKGENLGFTAYTFDKLTDKLSTKTKNLYCVVSDDNNNVLKKQLIKVENGVANGVFKIDDDFKHGRYKFKAYTNWMLNFSANNFFTTSFEVFDPKINKSLRKFERVEEINLQVLPESGHLLSNVINTVGVIAKDSLGYGIPFLKGDILDQNDNYITSFKLNKFGIGRFSFIPKQKTTYKLIYKYTNNQTVIFGEDIKVNGIILRVSRNEKNVIIACVTNKNSLSYLNKNNYILAIHNGSELKYLDFKFNDSNIVTKKIPLESLKSGVNIFTLFDSKNQPIAERLFFNYNNLSLNSVSKIQHTFDKSNSLNLNLKLENKIESFNNISISILPKATKSYNKNVNIISDIKLKPYINGSIENGSYYFTNINKQKKFDLDNLLITQGWSSYDWKNMFQYNVNYTHKFEKGISLKFNIQNNKNNSNSFLVHGLSNKFPEYISFEDIKESKSFIIDDFFPENGEGVFISEVSKKKGKLKKTTLYAQFFPSKIPETVKEASFLVQNNRFFPHENIDDLLLFRTLNSENLLDEFTIKTNIEKQRIKEIRDRTFGKVKFINKNERLLLLSQYININTTRFRAFEENGMLNIVNTRPTTIKTGTNPTVFLDGMRVLNRQMLFNYRLDIVDYIEFNPSGIGEGIFGRNGVIKIKTNPSIHLERRKKPTIRRIDFPISFTTPKKFYVPKYNSYNSNFYKHYGVVDWLPINKIDEKGNLSIKIENIKTNEITLFIEGVSKNNEFIYDKKTITLE